MVYVLPHIQVYSPVQLPLALLPLKVITLNEPVVHCSNSGQFIVLVYVIRIFQVICCFFEMHNYFGTNVFVPVLLQICIYVCYVMYTDTDTDAPNTKHTSSTTDTTATGKTIGVMAFILK